MTFYPPSWWQLYLETADYWVLNPQPYSFCFLYSSIFEFVNHFSFSSPLNFSHFQPPSSFFQHLMCFCYTVLTPTKWQFENKMVLIALSCLCLYETQRANELLFPASREMYRTHLLSPLSSCVCFPLSLSLHWALIWQMLKTPNCLFWSCFSSSFCVHVNMNGHWPLCNVWSRIHLVHLHLVCLSQPSICCWGESWVRWSCYCWPAGCCCLFGL